MVDNSKKWAAGQLLRDKTSGKPIQTSRNNFRSPPQAG
jgi:hypothetical protein